MANNIISFPKGFSVVPAHIAAVQNTNDLAAGISGGFGIISYRGKVWRTKFRGEETAIMRDDGDGPRNSIEVVVVKAAANLSKIYFPGGYKEGDSSPPDCFSTNGITPDPGASNKQSTTCAGCAKNAWGSRITEAGKAGKACSDSKRLAVVPAADMANESMGGPMLLRVPAASLQDLATFGTEMSKQGFPHNTFIVRISFDPDDAFPKFVFEPVRPLNADEQAIVLGLADSPVTQRILVEAVETAQHTTSPPAQVEGTLPKATKLFVAKPKVEAAVSVKVDPKSKDKAAKPVAARPKFDPNTGEKIVYADEQAVSGPKFDPETGKPIVASNRPAPEQLALPLEGEEDKPLPSFDDLVANLLNN